MRKPDDREDRSVRFLHPAQPVEAPFGFVENVRNAVARFGDVGVVAPDRRVFEIGVEQVDDIGRGPGGVFVEIARVIPSARQVALGRGIAGGAVQPRVAVLQRAEMRGGIGIAGAGMSGGLLLARTLIKERADRSAQDRRIDIGGDPERGRSRGAERG